VSESIAKAGRPDWERFALLGLYATGLPIGLIWLATGWSSSSDLTLLAVLTIPLILFVLAPLWLALIIGALISNWRMGPRVLAEWLGIPLAGILCVGLVLNWVPMRVRFELSRSAFDQAVATRRTEPGGIGLFSIDWISVEGDGSVYFTDADAGGLMGVCGLAYASSRGAVAHEILDLGGGWWYWCDD
jgi:hypothetical protein